MLKPPKYQWPQTDGSRGVLFFSQLLREMLTPVTFESHRVYSLDTLARLHEAKMLVEDIKRGRVPRIVLNPVSEEIDWSINNDFAAAELAGLEIKSFQKLIRSKDNFHLSDYASHINLIVRKLKSSYKPKLEQLILEKFDQTNDRINFRKIIGFYCSHLINIGYSRAYIKNKVDGYFFSTKIERIGRPSLRKFINEFDGKKKKFLVLAYITKDFALYMRGLGFKVKSVSDATTEQVAILSTNEENT